MKLAYKYIITLLILVSVSLILNQKKSESNSQTFRDLMKARTSLIASYCQKEDIIDYEGNINYQSVFIQDDFDFMWCPVFKASSTTWINYLMDLKVEKVKEKLI